MQNSIAALVFLYKKSYLFSLKFSNPRSSLEGMRTSTPSTSIFFFPHYFPFYHFFPFYVVFLFLCFSRTYDQFETFRQALATMHFIWEKSNRRSSRPHKMVLDGAMCIPHTLGKPAEFTRCSKLFRWFLASTHHTGELPNCHSSHPLKIVLPGVARGPHAPVQYLPVVFPFIPTGSLFPCCFFSFFPFSMLFKFLKD